MELMLDLDPRLLKIFASVMHCGSVTRASERLNTSQPSVSKALKRLEELVGFALFEPDGRNIYPTQKAQLLLESAVRIERELEETKQRILEIRSERPQGVRIAAISAISAALLPRAIVEFRKIHPGVPLKIELWRRELILSEIDAGRVDIGMLYSATQSVPSGFRILAEAPTLCVLPKGHRLSEKQVVTPEDFHGEKLIIYHNNLDFADPNWRILGTLDPSPEIVVEASQGAFLRDLVKHNVGISLLDGFTVNDAEMRGLVIRPFKPAIPFYLAIADQGQRLSSEAKDFLRLFSEIAVKIEADMKNLS
tara:strand:+ start:165 stop:1088 length:924 start_codon:yes stop_codon:yes gene_type:complete